MSKTQSKSKILTQDLASILSDDAVVLVPKAIESKFVSLALDQSVLPLSAWYGSCPELITFGLSNYCFSSISRESKVVIILPSFDDFRSFALNRLASPCGHAVYQLVADQVRNPKPSYAESQVKQEIAFEAQLMRSGFTGAFISVIATLHLHLLDVNAKLDFLRRCRERVTLVDLPIDARLRNQVYLLPFSVIEELSTRTALESAIAWNKSVRSNKPIDSTLVDSRDLPDPYADFGWEFPQRLKDLYPNHAAVKAAYLDRMNEEGGKDEK